MHALYTPRTRRSTFTPTHSFGRGGWATTSTSATNLPYGGQRSQVTSTCPACATPAWEHQFFGLVSLPVTKRMRGLSNVVHEQIDLILQAAERSPHELRLVRSAGEVEACRRDGVIGALLGIEGAHALEGELDRVESFARRGVRYLGFMHFTANDAGYPAYGQGRRDGEGLTPFGFELVRCCESAGVLVDLSHINRRGFLDACATATKPPIVSHTGVLGAHRHWRNIDDDQLRAVAKKGGVIGVIFFPRYLGGDGLEPVVQHLVHILNVVGEDTPALGSDWDGMDHPDTRAPRPSGTPPSDRRAPSRRTPRTDNRQDPSRKRDARLGGDLKTAHRPPRLPRRVILPLDPCAYWVSLRRRVRAGGARPMREGWPS